jgi:hypothetical protein
LISVSRYYPKGSAMTTITLSDITNRNLLNAIAALTLITFNEGYGGEGWTDALDSIIEWERDSELTSEALADEFADQFANWDAYTDATFTCLALLAGWGPLEALWLANGGE